MGPTLVVPVLLNVPNGVGRVGAITGVTGNLDLAESPLRQVDILGSQKASKDTMSQSESSRKRPQLSILGVMAVFIHNLDDPIIVGIAGRIVSIATDLPLCRSNGSLDTMTVQAAVGLLVSQTDQVAITQDPGATSILWDLSALNVFDDPVVVVILVVVAGNLLLTRSFRERLNMRVKQSSAISRVLDRYLRSIRHIYLYCPLRR